MSPGLNMVCFAHVMTCSVEIKAAKGLLKSREVLWKIFLTVEVYIQPQSFL